MYEVVSDHAFRFLRRLGGDGTEADGWSLDDRRTPLLEEGNLGPLAKLALSAEEHARNNLPDVLARWGQRDGAERDRTRTAQSFCVPKAEIAAAGYDLNPNRYKEVVHEGVKLRPPLEILTALRAVEEEIQRDMEHGEQLLA
jgi:type I restriction enzyme M protein